MSRPARIGGARMVLTWELQKKRRLHGAEIDQLIEIGYAALREIKYLRSFPRTIALDRRIEKALRRFDLVSLIISARSDYIVTKAPGGRYSYQLSEKLTDQDMLELDRLEAELGSDL